jgi:ribosomal protein S15P/S13E
MMKNNIMSWLTDPDKKANDGRMLFATYGKNLFLMRVISNTTDEKKIISILDNELRLLIGVDPLANLVGKKIVMNAVVVKPTQQTPDNQTGMIDPYPDKSNLPRDLMPVYEEKTKLYVEAKQYSAHLVVLGDTLKTLIADSIEYTQTVEKRNDLAAKITGTWDQINQAWETIHFFADNGQLPVVAEASPSVDIHCDQTDVMALDKRYRTLKTYISKNKKDVETNREKLVKWCIEINAIALILNARSDDSPYIIYNLESFSAK